MAEEESLGPVVMVADDDDHTRAILSVFLRSCGSSRNQHRPCYRKNSCYGLDGVG